MHSLYCFVNKSGYIAFSNTNQVQLIKKSFEAIFCNDYLKAVQITQQIGEPIFLIQIKMNLMITVLLSLLLLISVRGTDGNLQKDGIQTKSTSNGSFLFESIFGKKNVPKREPKQAGQTVNQRAIFKGLQSLKRPQDDSESSKEDNGLQLPYQALLPRKRTPLQFKLENAQKLFGSSEAKQQIINPLEQQNLRLNQTNQNQSEEKIVWQNPMFTSRQDGNLLPFYNIFGKKKYRKNKYTQSISESEVYNLLVQKAPFLTGGKVIKITTNQYKKGIFLNVQYQDKRNKLFNVIARYRPKKHQLEIISIKQNDFIRKINHQLSPVKSEDFQIKAQGLQNQLKYKEEELKTILEKLQKIEEKLQEKNVQKEQLASKAEVNAKKKSQSQAAKSNLKEEIAKQVPKVNQNTQKPAVKDKQQKVLLNPSQNKNQNTTSESASKPKDINENKNIVNQ